MMKRLFVMKIHHFLIVGSVCIYVLRPNDPLSAMLAEGPLWPSDYEDYHYSFSYTLKTKIAVTYGPGIRWKMLKLQVSPICTFIDCGQNEI